MLNIIGIDPGSNITGYGVISVDGKKIAHVKSGTIKVRGFSLTDKFGNILNGLMDVIALHNPAEAAVEKVFVHINAGSALKLGEARGAALAALANANLSIAEYSAKQVKQAVVGFGAAKKNQVQHMVKALLQMDKIVSQDAADALAIAICHANHRDFARKYGGGMGKGAKGGNVPNSWRKFKI